MAKKNYRLNFEMSNGSTQSVEFAVPYDDSREIPAYWDAELHAGVEQIRTALESAGQNKSAFLWYHDAHWTNNARISPKLMEYLCRHTAIDKVNFGGDIVSTETAQSREDWAYLYQWRDAVRDLPKHHSVRGNHDDDIPGLQTDKAIYAFLMGGEDQEKVVRGGDFFYYMDDVGAKTRYLYLDTHMCTTSTNPGNPDEVKFVVDALNSTPEKWHIVPIAHIWFLYTDWNTPTVGDFPNYCKQLLDIFDAYNARGKGLVTMNGVQVDYDFAGGTGKVEFCMGGHTHVDMDVTSADGIPVILTEADCYEWRSGYDATPGTVGEAAVTGIIADYDAGKICVIRIGRGVSREVPLKQSAAGYTNILDQVGYVANKRLSQSAGYAEADQTGVCLTGYIPVNTGDTLYFKNMTLTETYHTGYDQHLYIFDGNKVGMKHGHISDYDGDAGVVATEYEVDENGVRHFTQMTYLDDPGYIRINAVHIGSNSIITINEKIH